MENDKRKKIIENDKERYETYYAEKIENENLKVYVNEETDSDGKILSAYIGLEDENGRAETGFDMEVEFLEFTGAGSGNWEVVINWDADFAYEAQCTITAKGEHIVELAGDYLDFDHFGVRDDDTEDEIREKIIEWYLDRDDI
jgi:hypothetical protein